MLLYNAVTHYMGVTSDLSTINPTNNINILGRKIKHKNVFSFYYFLPFLS